MSTEMTKKTRLCSYCNQPIPGSKDYWADDYTDVPENHAPRCPIREIMELRLSDERREAEAAKTVKVRIAVAIEPDGDWASAGWGPNEKDAVLATDALFNVDRAAVLRWVTADVPLPVDGDDIVGEVE